MKISFSLLSITIAGLLFLTACSKHDEATPPAASQTPPAPAPAVVDSTPKVEPAAVADVKAKADAAMTQATAPAETIKAPEIVATPPAAPPAVASSAQSILERARTLVAEQKYTEALAALSELSTASLTADQQNLVTQLKTKISDAMAAKAGNEGLKSIGGLLDRKK